MNHFSYRWKNEYLIELRDSHRHSGKSSNSTPIAFRDIVVVHNEELPRGFWRLARANDLVRDATSRMKSKNYRSSPSRRPIQLLYPLEIRGEDKSVASDDHGNPAVNHAGEGFQPPNQPRRKLRRVAAVESERRREAWIEELV